MMAEHWLKIAREKAGMSRKELAEALFISCYRLEAIESGGSFMTPKGVKKACDILKCEHPFSGFSGGRIECSRIEGCKFIPANE